MATMSLKMSLKNYPVQLLQALDSQRHLPAYCDVVLVSGNGLQYHAHSCVLAASSSFLNEQLKISDMKKQVSLADHSGEIIQLFLEVLYTGKLDVSEGNTSGYLQQLKTLATVIDVQSVVELCDNFIAYANSLVSNEYATSVFTDVSVDKLAHSGHNESLNELVNMTDNSQSFVAATEDSSIPSAVTGSLEQNFPQQGKNLSTQTSGVCGEREIKDEKTINPEDTVKLLHEVVSEEMNKLQEPFMKDTVNESPTVDHNGSNLPSEKDEEADQTAVNESPTVDHNGSNLPYEKDGEADQTAVNESPTVDHNGGNLPYEKDGEADQTAVNESPTVDHNGGNLPYEKDGEADQTAVNESPTVDYNGGNLPYEKDGEADQTAVNESPTVDHNGGNLPSEKDGEADQTADSSGKTVQQKPVTGELNVQENISDLGSDSRFDVSEDANDCNEQDEIGHSDGETDVNVDKSNRDEINSPAAESVTQSSSDKIQLDPGKSSQSPPAERDENESEGQVEGTNKQYESQSNEQSPTKAADDSEKRNSEDTTSDKGAVTPTTSTGRSKGRLRKGTPHKVQVSPVKSVKQRRRMNDPVVEMVIKKDEPVLLSPTGRPRRRAAELNIYIGKRKAANKSYVPEIESDCDDGMLEAEDHSTPKNESGNKERAVCSVKKESLHGQKKSHAPKTPKGNQSSPVGQSARKRGRPPKRPRSVESDDDDDEYVPSVKMGKAVYKSARKQEVLFSDGKGDVYLEKEDGANSTSVFECFSKITSQLLKYRMEGGPEKQAAENVASYMEDLVEFEVAGTVQTVNQQQEVRHMFQMVLGRLQDYKSQEEGEEEKKDKTQQKQPDGDALFEWKNCRYCSKFKGKKKGRFEFHANYCNSNFKCALCYKPFLNEHDLNKHHCNKMDRWICDLCGKILSDKPTLQLHKKNHLGIKNKMCSYCGKSFMRSCHLQAHIAHVHVKERPFRCNQCGAAFALNYELNRHMQKHSETPNYMCTVCGLSFYERTKLNHHVKTRHNERPANNSTDALQSTTILIDRVDEFAEGIVQKEEQVEIESAVDHIIQSASMIEQKEGEVSREVHLVLQPGGFGYVAYPVP